MEIVTTADVRGEMKEDAETLRLMDHPDSTEEIPILDMGPYLRGEPGGLEKVAAELRTISQTVGFFYLRAHGIAQEVIDRIFAESRRFHALPESEKKKVSQIDVDGFKSGYEPPKTSQVRTNVNIISDAKPNLLAKFSVNREGGSAGRTRPREKVNLWPDNLPGFRDGVMDYYARIEKLGRQFLPLWAKSLRLPLDFFDQYFHTPHLTLSLLNYPPQTHVGDRQYGIAPHTDNSLMTFLAQANVSGLAVRMPSGHWRMVEAIPGTLLVNTGNLMVRWTNGEYLSTKHRVININDVDRYSIPVFFGPSGDALIKCLPTCQGPDRPPLYEPITYEDLRRWYYSGR